MDEPTRLLLWHWGRKGGGPKYTLELAKALRKRQDVDLHWSLSNQSEMAKDCRELTIPGLWVDTYNSLPGFITGTFRVPWLRHQLQAYLKKHRIDLVLCTMGHLWNPAVSSVIKKAGSRYILTLHDAQLHPGEENKIREFMIRKELNQTDGILTLTQHVRDLFLSQSPYPGDFVEVAPHGVFSLAKGAKPRTLPQDRKVRVLFFGRVLRYKGLHLLLEAMADLEKTHPQLELSIIGPGDTAPYQEAIDRLKSVRLENRWIEEEEIPQIFAEHDIVALPYIEASQSGVVATAMGAGVPSIATRIGGLPEQIQHKENGLLCDEINASSVRKELIRFLEEPNLYEKCSKGALDMAKNTFSWDAVADRILNFCKTVLTSEGR